MQIDTKEKEEKQTGTMSEFERLLEDRAYTAIPKIGDVVKGRVISVSRHEVKIDIEGFRTGVVRGRELIDESHEFADLKVGDEVGATVVDLDNENGELEMSFRFAGHKKAWDKLAELRVQAATVSVKVMEANKGGLIVSVNHVQGFLPVSQLAPEHYPRVVGGDKGKILEKLKSYIGASFNVKIIDVSETENKLITSEKAVWEEEQRSVIEKYKVGDVVEGMVSAITDFGAFVRFDDLEGLVHISEIAWQRIDHPRDLLSLEQKVRAEIIGVDGSKIFLSMKKLIDDPWKRVYERYKVGDVVKGTVLKINPFGLFVELDPEIHGLVHVSELDTKPVSDPSAFAKVGDKMEFKIVSVEPEHHRLGLSLKALKKPTKTEEESLPSGDIPQEDEKKTETKENKTEESVN